ncbi:MAG: histidinol-phosphate transaminase [Gammaproteobacteria bacterium]|nr:histidinol-phosphate transaminase [Gammaproteobacteria bacterium]
MKSPQQLIRPEIQALSAYHVPESGNLIKLDAMENPYTWPEEMVQEWLQDLRDVSINRYPDPSAQQLSMSLREAFTVPKGMEILMGNGSDELIQMIAMAVAEKDRVILAPQPSFVMYKMIATFTGMQFVGVPLNADDFSLDMHAMHQAIDKHQPAVIFLAYPNNPTGNLFAEEQVREIIEQAPGLVVVDEAYAAFAEHSFMSALGEYDNLLVMRTVSKMGLAGLRLGLLAGSKEWLHEIDKVRLPYNINVLTQKSAVFALKHKQVLDQQTKTICDEREKMFKQMQEVKGIEPYPSQANFILFRCVPGTASAIFESLLEGGVLIKNMNAAGGALADCLRVTVGTPEENQFFLSILQ